MVPLSMTLSDPDTEFNVAVMDVAKR